LFIIKLSFIYGFVYQQLWLVPAARLPFRAEEANSMKRFFKVLGWVFLGVLLQFKLNALYGIVFLENLNFHERTYYVKMNLVPTEESLRVLHLETTVHHSLGPDYFANVYIPEEYQVLNKEPYKGAEALPGYNAYKMGMKRKYRDVLAVEDLIIAPKVPDVAAKPLVVHFENLKQRLHADESYQLSVTGKKTALAGPELVEARYPQKLGM